MVSGNAVAGHHGRAHVEVGTPRGRGLGIGSRVSNVRRTGCRSEAMAPFDSASPPQTLSDFSIYPSHIK